MAKPTKSESNVFVYEKDTKYSYLPTGYDSTSMKITYSEQTKLGTHTAKVVPNSNHKWNSGTDNEELIPDGLLILSGSPIVNVNT